MLHGFGYTAFVIDAFVGLIVALRMLIGRRHRLLRTCYLSSFPIGKGKDIVGNTIHRSDAGSQYCALRLKGDPICMWIFTIS